MTSRSRSWGRLLVVAALGVAVALVVIGLLLLLYTVPTA
jgi:hypothetical protein